MTPIGSTSSNIRRAIEFMVDPSFCDPGASERTLTISRTTAHRETHRTATVRTEISWVGSRSCSVTPPVRSRAASFHLPVWDDGVAVRLRIMRTMRDLPHAR